MLGSLFKRRPVAAKENLNNATTSPAASATNPPKSTAKSTNNQNVNINAAKMASVYGSNLKPLLAKSVPITNDYSISDKVLGLGINGKVVECYHRETGNKFALKVITSVSCASNCLPIVYHCIYFSFFRLPSLI